METTLVNYQVRLEEQHEKLLRALGDYKSDEKIASSLSAIQKMYDEKIAIAKPEIMFFGIYNAGKSSILNELIREDRATVADKPTTDKVDYYDWNGYKIADTPGVGAPIEHEKVTTEHLKKADVVLFVMSTTGSNEKRDNYIRMKEIVDAGKKVLIVLNDKNGDLGDEEGNYNLELVKQKVFENIKQIGIEKDCKIIVVNAARAHKGRVENKKILYEKSNFIELENAIKSELKRTNSFFALKTATDSIIQNVIDIENLLQVGNEDIEIIELRKVISLLDENKRLMRKELAEYIKRQCSKLEKTLPDEIWAFKDNQEHIQEIVNGKSDEIALNIDRQLKSRVDDLQSDLKVQLNHFVDVIGKVKPGSMDIIQTSEKNVDVKGMAFGMLEFVEKILRNWQAGKGPIGIPPVYSSSSSTGDSLAGKVSTSIVGQELAKQAIKHAVKSGLITKGVASTVGKFVPYIGPILIGIDLLKMFMGNGNKAEIDGQLAAENAQNQARLEAEERARISLQQNCKYLAEDLCDQFICATNSVINEVIGKFENEFDDKIECSKGSESLRLTTLRMVQEVNEQLAITREELSGLSA